MLNTPSEVTASHIWEVTFFSVYSFLLLSFPHSLTMDGENCVVRAYEPPGQSDEILIPRSSPTNELSSEAVVRRITEDAPVREYTTAVAAINATKMDYWRLEDIIYEGELHVMP